MQTVRKRILEILKQQGQATVSELATLLEMAPVSVRYHLDILQGDRLIEASTLRRKGSVGRPTQVYSLTQDADEFFPDNFAALTAGLIQQMKKMLSPEQVDTAFCALAQEMAAECVCRNNGKGDARARLDQVVDFLNERGYFARWEEDQEGRLLLHTHNCPYAGVSTEHPELCRMDSVLVQELTGLPCERLDAVAEGGDCCTYRVAARPEEESLSFIAAPVTHLEN